eukprot:TRINITY_DN12127_c0_g2_i9.p1 TRINITY_DN12127_c0_g2~~TRINITY_DN12127_c0_g2_i9.p1  ORF type:complete len:357 (+),score=21.14 TRINITY_DN12127_c0_g2_i9:788-1858(+)
MLVSAPVITWQYLKSSDNACLSWSGLDLASLNMLDSLLLRAGAIDIWSEAGVGRGVDFHQLLVTLLLRVRKGLAVKDCAALAGLHRLSNLSRIFERFVCLLHTICSMLDPTSSWTDELTAKCKAQPFRGFFDSVDLVADCSSTPTDASGNTFIRDRLFSAYYGGTCAKWAIGLGPTGHILWFSRMYAGNVSDDDISIEDGILTRIGKGRVLLYDKGGGTLRTRLEEDGKGYLCPHTKVAGRLTTGEVVSSRIISNRRGHVERAVRRLKHFRFLTSRLHHASYAQADMLFAICVFLCNLQGPIKINETTVGVAPAQNTNNASVRAAVADFLVAEEDDLDVSFDITDDMDDNDDDEHD